MRSESTKGGIRVPYPPDFMRETKLDLEGEEIQVRQTTVPDVVLRELEKVNGHYGGKIKTVFYFVWLDGDAYCGVAGDGENASYEAFTYKHGRLRITDCSYGCTATALFHALAENASV
jgi:hypothetical protein